MASGGYAAGMAIGDDELSFSTGHKPSSRFNPKAAIHGMQLTTPPDPVLSKDHKYCLGIRISWLAVNRGVSQSVQLKNIPTWQGDSGHSPGYSGHGAGDIGHSEISPTSTSANTKLCPLVRLSRVMVKKKTQRDPATKMLIGRINSALDAHKQPVTQIFVFDGITPRQMGSGFYIKYENATFLVSAAHVFDDDPINERWVFNESGVLQKLSGRFAKHRFAGNRDDDINDLVAIEVDFTNGVEPYPQNILDLTSTFDAGLYAFAGFPATKNGLKYGKNEFKKRPYSYFDKSVKAASITSFQYDDASNVLIRYQHKKCITANLGPQRGVRMKGISGGPVLWLTQMMDLASWEPGRIKISAIVIHTVEQHGYMAGARIKTLLDAISNKSAIQSEFDVFVVSP